MTDLHAANGRIGGEPIAYTVHAYIYEFSFPIIMHMIVLALYNGPRSVFLL